ncbi:MAG TPA: ABC transporter ATP-binding protein [Nitrospiria bacterium]|nr:ABC transporter ATP-binding protein [Nitrospiria bacterium]
MTADWIIETRALRREFGDTVAVSDVTLRVPKGVVLALVGPNGAGKTTLLKMLSGLLEPTSGTAVVGQIDVRERPRDVHALLGFLPDFFGLYDDLMVEDYLDVFARAYRVRPEQRAGRVRDALDRVGLSERGATRVGTLSRGMRQRLGIARTLIHDPPLLLLDEPASGLDPEIRYELQELFVNLARSGKTLVVSSHILAELEAYCTHVAVLRGGRLVASGSIEDVRRGLSARRRIRIRAADRWDAISQILGARPTVSGISQSGGDGVFEHAGEESDLVDILRALVSAGVPVSAFAEDRGTIQDTYLALMEERS